jgi:hypothetical protein
MRTLQATAKMLALSLCLGGFLSLSVGAQDEPADNPGRTRTPQGGRALDTNGDGVIDPSERQAARERLGNRPGAAPRPGAQQRPGTPQRPAEGTPSGEPTRRTETPDNGRGQGPGALLGPQERAALMRRYDADGDGQLSPEERQAAMQAMGMNGNVDRQAIMRRFDADGDGQLSNEERAKLQAEVRNQMQNGAGAAAFGTGPASSGEAAIREIVDTSGLRQKFDADGDGQLSAAERATARAAVGKEK